MAITIRSPHNGRPVKVREQDLGRAIRDDEGHVFYVLPRAAGQGHYGSRTRQGSAAEEQHYDEVEAQPPTAAAEATAPAGHQPDVHDATGPGRPGSELRWRMALAVLILVALFVAIFLTWHFWPGEATPPAPQPVPEQQHEPGAVPPEDPGAQADPNDAPMLWTIKLPPPPHAPPPHTSTGLPLAA